MAKFTRPVLITLFSAFIMNFAGFAILTFLAVYLTIHLHLNDLQVGTVFSVITVTSRILPLFTGILAEKVRPINLMILGLCLRGGGFLLLGVNHSFGNIVIAAALTGIGAALYSPSAYAIFGSEPENTRKKVFPILNQCLNAGAISGPLVGSLFIKHDPFYLFLISALLFFLLALGLFIQKKNFKIQKINPSVTPNSIKSIINNKLFVYYSLAMILFWFMYAQLTVSLPLRMLSITNNESFVSLVITTNALTGLLLMFFLKKFYEKHRSIDIVKVGVLMMGASLIMVSLYKNPIWMVLSVIVFTIGETLVLPASDITVAEFSKSQFTASYFGFFQLSFAIGSVLGSYSGAWFMDKMKDNMLPWLLFGLAGLIGSFLLNNLAKRVAIHTSVINRKQIFLKR